MSLDVNLIVKGVQNPSPGEHIFVREDSGNKEISREEWDKRFPGREPVTVELPSDSESVYSANITHNLGEMANKAGIYYALWHPEEKGYKYAKDIIPVLEKGLKKLKEKPEYFRKFNAYNGWGLYEHFVPFVENYLEACKEYPDAEIEVSV